MDCKDLFEFIPLKRKKLSGVESCSISTATYGEAKTRHSFNLSQLNCSQSTNSKFSQSQRKVIFTPSQNNQSLRKKKYNRANIVQEKVVSSKVTKKINNFKNESHCNNRKNNSHCNNSSLSYKNLRKLEKDCSVNIFEKSDHEKKATKNKKLDTQLGEDLKLSTESDDVIEISKSEFDVLSKSTVIFTNSEKQNNAQKFSNNEDEVPDINYDKTLENELSVDKNFEKQNSFRSLNEIPSCEKSESSAMKKMSLKHNHDLRTKNVKDRFKNDASDINDFEESEATKKQKEVSIKVKSWMNSYLDFVPENIEILPKSCLPADVSYDNAAGNLHKAEIEREVSSILKPDQCVHFHFNIPLKQSAITDFFKQTTHDIDKEVKMLKEPLKKPANFQTLCNENVLINSNSVEVISTWKKMFKCLRSANSTRRAGKNYLKSSSKICPPHKFIEGTNFVVDAFNYGSNLEGITGYFLSHFHSDHYAGLNKKFNGTLFCNKITANLVHFKLKVPQSKLNILQMNKPYLIDGIEITLLDANHCPGSVMFLFKLPSGKSVLHVGDFRASKSMEEGILWNHVIDILYLDTTYLDCYYNFMSQNDALDMCVDIVREHNSTGDDAVFIIGSYFIGKEKVFKTVAKELNSKIYVQSYKKEVLDKLEDDEINKRVTEEKKEARVHVLKMMDLKPSILKPYLDSLHPEFKCLISIKPSGWEHCDTPNLESSHLLCKNIGNIYMYGVPYSEHSSYTELKRFVKFLTPKKIIPTVFRNEAQRRKYVSVTENWLKGKS